MLLLLRLTAVCIPKYLIYKYCSILGLDEYLDNFMNLIAYGYRIKGLQQLINEVQWTISSS